MPLTDEQRKGFLEIKSTPAEDAVKAAEMATKDLDYDMTSAERAAAGFDRADPDFDRSPTWARHYQTALRAAERSFVKESVHEADFSVVLFLKMAPSLQQPPP